MLIITISKMIILEMIRSYFTLCSYIWYTSKFDSTEEKRWSWIFVLFFFWPQYQAFKIIVGIVKGKNERGDDDDRKRQRKVLNLSPKTVNCVYITKILNDDF